MQIADKLRMHIRFFNKSTSKRTSVRNFFKSLQFKYYNSDYK